MKTACNKNLDVFDFKPETEVSEFAIRNKSKLENPRRAIDKYSFLETAASGRSISAEEINYVPSLDIGTINMNHMATTLVEIPSAAVMTDSDDTFTAVEQHPQSSPEIKTDFFESEVNVGATSVSPRNNRPKSAILDLLPSLHEVDDAVGMDTNENGSMWERSPSSSHVAEDDGVPGFVAEPSLDPCIDVWERGGEDIPAIVLYPDYVLYSGSYYTDSIISFTSSFIEMEGSEVDEDDRTFKCKWGIEDILHITSHWYERVEMAMVKIHLLAKDTKLAKNVECATGTELKFSVIGSSWFEGFEAIVSLNITYKALWTSMLDSEGTVVGHHGISSSNYLPRFDRPFEEVVYPKGDADAVSICKRDFDLLEPEIFVNDTIIDFYIKYLKNKIKPDERHRFHFFNSFFFRKLADPDKDPLGTSKGAVAYQRVKKWTRKVNLFDKDYVFIPVNYNYHWSLIVMCHLGEVAIYEDEDVNKSLKVPCVLHMDSFRGSHTGLQGHVQSYLKEEWKARQPVAASEEISSRFDNLRFISLELPQQQNSYDCGLFLLHYVELFLKQAPLHFNPFKISKDSSFLNVDWFPPAEASLKRVVIQKLICDLLENPHQETYSPAADIDQRCHLSNLTSNAHKGTVVNLSPVDSVPVIPHHQSSQDHQESNKCADDSNIALKPSFESEINCASTLYECLEEDMQQGNGINHDESSLPRSSQDCTTTGPSVTADHITMNIHHESLPEITISEYEMVNKSSQQLDTEIDQPRSPVPHALPVYGDKIVDGNDDDDDLTLCMDILKPGSSFRFSEIQINGPEKGSGLESDVQQQPTKKMRMSQPRKVSPLL